MTKTNDEILSMFQNMSAARRVDLVVRLLHQCLPLELRFFGIILQELCFKSYDALTRLETNCNRINYYIDLSTVHDDPKKLCMGLSLLHLDNLSVASHISKLLSADSPLAVCGEFDSVSKLEEYRLLYLLALNHPAIDFEKTFLLKRYLKALDRMYEALVNSVSQSDVNSTDSVGLGIPYPSVEARLQQCEVIGVYRRRSDKRFLYAIDVDWNDGTSYTIYRPYGDFFSFQSKLLDLFPDEAGGKNKKARVIPFLPGKRFPFTSKNSRETAEKRFPEIVKYIRTLLNLPDYIIEHKHVVEFFRPKQHDVAVQDLEKIKTITNGDDHILPDKKSSTLTYNTPVLPRSIDRCKTFPSSGNSSDGSPKSPRRKSSTPFHKPVHTLPSPLEYDEALDNSSDIINLHNHICSSLKEENNEETAKQNNGDSPTLYLTPQGSPEIPARHKKCLPLETSAASTPGGTTMVTGTEMQSERSSVTESTNSSPAHTPDVARSESCQTIHNDGFFSEENFLQWLKSHRLHKYAKIFRGMTLQQICHLRMADLRRHGMTIGAATKFLKKIHEWHVHLGQADDGVLSNPLPRYPSTFSLPSYLLDAQSLSSAMRHSSSSHSLEPAAGHKGTPASRKRLDSTTSTHSSISESISEQAEGSTSDHLSSSMSARSEHGDLNSKQVANGPTSNSPHSANSKSKAETQRGLSHEEASFLEYPTDQLNPEFYNSDGIVGGKRLPPRLNFHGTYISMANSTLKDGTSPPNIPLHHQAPGNMVYTPYGPALPVYNRRGSPTMFRMPHPQPLPPNNGFILQPMMPQAQYDVYLSQDTCYNCGLFGHRGLDCLARGMETSEVSFHKVLGKHVQVNQAPKTPTTPVNLPEENT